MTLHTQKRDGGQELERRKLAIKSMEHVLSIPSGTPERWRAAFNHFLKQRPDAAENAIEIATAVQKRKQRINKFASTKNGRLTTGFPEWLMGLLRQTDPDYFSNKTSKGFASAKHLRLMQKAFPEYFYPEVI
ncbi:MAG: hypothetical protein ACOH18_05595 [Candidatus Saccharimonadaceae bacterium]